MAEQYRIVCTYKKTLFRNGCTSNYIKKYKVQKRSWFGWFTPLWFKWETAGEYCSEKWRAIDYLNSYLAHKGAVTRKVREVVDTFETE